MTFPGFAFIVFSCSQFIKYDNLFKLYVILRVEVQLFSTISQKMTKCCRNIRDTLTLRLVCNFSLTI